MADRPRRGDGAGRGRGAVCSYAWYSASPEPWTTVRVPSRSVDLRDRPVGPLAPRCGWRWASRGRGAARRRTRCSASAASARGLTRPGVSARRRRRARGVARRGVAATRRTRAGVASSARRRPRRRRGCTRSHFAVGTVLPAPSRTGRSASRSNRSRRRRPRRSTSSRSSRKRGTTRSLTLVPGRPFQSMPGDVEVVLDQSRVRPVGGPHDRHAAERRAGAGGVDDGAHRVRGPPRRRR